MNVDTLDKYKEHLKSEGIYKYITDFVSTPLFLINNQTGELGRDNATAVCCSTYRYDNYLDCIKEFKKFDKVYILFNETTKDYYRDRIRFYAWKRTIDVDYKKLLKIYMKNIFSKHRTFFLEQYPYMRNITKNDIKELKRIIKEL